MKNEKGMLEKNTRFAIKKLSIGAAAVLVSTSMYLGMRSSNVLAETNDGTNTSITAKNNDSNSSEESSSNSETVSSQNNKKDSAVTETPVEAPAQNNDDLAGHSTSEVNTPVTSAPLYTTQGQLPALDMNSMFTQEQLDQYGDNPQIDWVTKPDVTNIGNVTGTAKLTYEDMNADPAEDGTIPTKTATVNVPVLVRKAEQEVKENQVKNSLDVINSSNNSLVAHYEWVGDKAANDEDEGISIPGRDAFESNFMTIIEKLGFELDDYSEFPEDLMTFGTTNKSATLFVHPISNKPVIADDPYFDNNGYSTIDNVNKTPDAANYIGNLGTLPEGTKIEWNVVNGVSYAPTYDYTKDEDGDYKNPEPTNNPQIKVTIPGKDPIILDGDTLKEWATLPDYYGDGTLLINPNNTLDLDSNAKAPTEYVTNLDSFIKKYLADNGEEANADNIQDFKDSFKWTITPNTQQAGYTFGIFNYNDNSGELALVLFKVNPTKVDNSKTITRTITFEGLPQDLIPKVDPQTVTFKQNGQQTYVDEPIEWKTDDNTWKAITLKTITANGVVYTPTIDGKAVNSIDGAIVNPDTKDSKVTVTYQKSTTGDTISEPAKSVGTVVIYQTKDGKVVKTDVKEQKPGDKVEFNVPDGYVPADKLPDVTVMSDMKPIKIIVIKKETATDTPEIVSNNKVASVVIYQTKDGKVVKTDVKEQKPGDKV
ncbi:YSIRK-type signal peptide-containing protein, partial [Lactobacillus rodentium]|uniref:mucin-binding protein n=1 Tax=Lactobacillus rodentium TaxID=947835 RepID=UPI00214BBB15